MNAGSSLVIFLLGLLCNIPPAFSSNGDRSPLYQKCNLDCMRFNCTKDGKEYLPHMADKLELAPAVLRWKCYEECRYHCMWDTVAAFQRRGLDMPKFHGKWPFKRILGLQEPASAAFSALNLAAHLRMLLRIASDRRFQIGKTPLLRFWYFFCAVCMHAWFWSTVFHSRDGPATEFMDYACALSMVMMLFISAVVRVFYSRRVVMLSIVAGTLFYFLEHIKYLYRGSIDYEFNMIVNISVGSAGAFLWVCYMVSRLRAARYEAVYVWRLAAFLICSTLGLVLEVFDFPPIAGTVDAHALWHLTTAPLPLWFYRFVMDDMDALQSTMQLEKKMGAKLS